MSNLFDLLLGLIDWFLALFPALLGLLGGLFA